MNIRRTRAVAAAACALLALVSFFFVARLAAHADGARVDSEAIDEARNQIDQALVAEADGKKPESNRLWYVSADGVEAYGDTNVQPPFLLLFRKDSRAITTERFVQSDVEYLAYAYPLKLGEGYATVVDLGPYKGERATLVNRLRWAGLNLMALAAWFGWWLAGRILKPAREAFAERRGFLADAAHEMRTPLAVILASASQSLARPRTSEEYVRSLAEIRAAAERASAGVTELLDLARLESGQAMPRLAPLRLDLLAEEVAASVRTDGCTLQAEPSSTAVVVDADLGLLRQALDNVVRNATARATVVTLSSHIDGRDGVLSVSDNGPGFDEKSLPNVFDRYRRGDKNGQIGLGLSLVQAIVKAHGGEIQVANGPDGGALVTLRVPLSRGLSV